MRQDISPTYYIMNHNGQDYRVNIHYNKGNGYHLERLRGYYVSITPVTRQERAGYVVETSTPHLGTYARLVECKRMGKGAEARALQAFEEMRPRLLAHLDAKQATQREAERLRNGGGSV